jgi:hypothetical protein
MLVCLVLIIFSSSVTIFVTRRVTLILERITILGAFSIGIEEDEGRVMNGESPPAGRV